jgi:hypothetical protein
MWCWCTERNKAKTMVNDDCQLKNWITVYCQTHIDRRVGERTEDGTMETTCQRSDQSKPRWCLPCRFWESGILFLLELGQSPMQAKHWLEAETHALLQDISVTERKGSRQPVFCTDCKYYSKPPQKTNYDAAHPGARPREKRSIGFV